MELLNPQLFNCEYYFQTFFNPVIVFVKRSSIIFVATNRECKTEPSDRSFENNDEISFCSQDTLVASQVSPFPSDEHSTRPATTVPRISMKSVQAINSGKLIFSSFS